MRKDRYTLPKSSFLSVDKDLKILVDKILSNKSLKKLLYYTSPDALSKPAVPDNASAGMYGNQIKVVPKVYVDKENLQYVIITFDNFVTNATNPEFRDNIINFDIICHYRQWQLDTGELRPYRIAAELDSMLDKARLTGIGLLEFLGASQIVINDEFAGLSLSYQAIHGGEDKLFKPDPVADIDMINEYNERENHHGYPTPLDDWDRPTNP